jgi:hypothetical protein
MTIAAALVEIRPTLIDTSRKEPDPAEGGPKVIKGDYFFSLKEMGGKAIESAVKLAIAAVLAGHGHIDPAHAKEIFIEPGASADEIRDYFKDRGQLVPKGLEATLADLSHGDPSVLAAQSYGGRGPFCQVRF